MPMTLLEDAYKVDFPGNLGYLQLHVTGFTLQLSSVQRLGLSISLDSPSTIGSWETLLSHADLNTHRIISCVLSVELFGRVALAGCMMMQLGFKINGSKM